MVPRWEFRTFGADFGELELRLCAAAPSTRTSEERYVVGRRSRTNVKVRDGALDVKALDRVNADGLQLWRPVLKAFFPVDTETVRAVAQLLAVPVPVLHRDRYSVDEWLNAVVAHQPDLTPVHVKKVRHGSVLSGCLVEIAYLVVNGTPVTTIAVESENPAFVVKTVRALDLADRPNEDYVTALKRLAVHETARGGAAPWRAHP